MRPFVGPLARRIGLACLVWLAAATAALAVLPDEMLKNPALEARARALTADLRCVVCEGQAVDDSEAGIARDIRILVRERLTAGDDEAAVRRYLVARYGNYILLKPPLAPQTILLWGTPALALLLGAIAIVVGVRRASRARLDAPPLEAAEAGRLDALLAQEAQVYDSRPGPADEPRRCPAASAQPTKLADVNEAL